MNHESRRQSNVQVYFLQMNKDNNSCFNKATTGEVLANKIKRIYFCVCEAVSLQPRICFVTRHRNVSWVLKADMWYQSIREQCPQEIHRMTEVIRLDAATSVSSVCLSSNNVPRAFSSKWRAGLEGPEGRYVQMTLSPCPNSSAMLYVQLNQQLHSSSWQDSSTYTEDF